MTEECNSIPQSLQQADVGIYLLIYLLTHYKQQSPSWEANRFSASQETPRILWNT